jgi:cysteinyl-tRNA synthetase
MNLDLDAMRKEVKSTEIPDIPLAQIYHKKAKEINNKISFLKAFKDQNIADMNLYSEKIYGGISQENFEKSKERISSRDTIREEEEFLEYDEIRDYMKKFNNIYGIKVKMKESNSTSRFSMK